MTDMRLRRGQTLIEVLLSLAIILVGILSLTSALINAQITAAASVDAAIAVQLAREPIEAARFIRDSNWLERENGLDTVFNDRLESSTEVNDYTATYQWNAQLSNLDNAVQFNFDADNNADPDTAVYRGPAGLYRHPPSSALPGYDETIYSRYITLYPICSSDGGVTETIVSSDGVDCGSVTQIGVQVISTVAWSSRNTEHKVGLEERIYDWRYATS